MKKKLLIFALLALSLPGFLCARDRVVDNAGLLSDAEKTELESRLAEVASAYAFDLVIVTETDIGGALLAAYADDFFDNHGYGPGGDRDGSLFLQVTGSRDYFFSTSGRGIKILNNSAYGRLESGVLRFLRNDDTAGASRAFINAWDEFLALDAKGRSYNFFHQWNAVLVLVAWVIAILIGFIVVQGWKAQMNTALPQKQAAAYMVPGSLAFTARKESFLYSRESKTKTASSSLSSSLAGGGGRVSSSGRTHGGRGGKY
jgi:uncharacterized protein